MPEKIAFTKEEVGDVTVVTLSDKQYIELDYVQWVSTQLFELVDIDHRQKIVIDFSNAEYLSSDFLMKLVTLEKKVKAAGWQLRMTNIREDILEVFKITRLHRFFKISESREKALEDLAM